MSQHLKNDRITETVHKTLTFMVTPTVLSGLASGVPHNVFTSVDFPTPESPKSRILLLLLFILDDLNNKVDQLQTKTNLPSSTTSNSRTQIERSLKCDLIPRLKWQKRHHNGSPLRLLGSVALQTSGRFDRLVELSHASVVLATSCRRSNGIDGL